MFERATFMCCFHGCYHGVMVIYQLSCGTPVERSCGTPVERSCGTPVERSEKVLVSRLAWLKAQTTHPLQLTHIAVLRFNKFNEPGNRIEH